jgi:hypothetical protein
MQMLKLYAFRHDGAGENFQTARCRRQTDSRSGRKLIRAQGVGFWIAAEINLSVPATPVISLLPAKGRDGDMIYFK